MPMKPFFDSDGSEFNLFFFLSSVIRVYKVCTGAKKIRIVFCGKKQEHKLVEKTLVGRQLRREQYNSKSVFFVCL